MARRILLQSWLIAVFACLAPAVMAQSTYRLSPGDVLQIEVLEDSDLNRSVLIAPDGRITFPLAGSVRAGGRTIGAVQTELTAQLAPNFSSRPSVFVSLQSRPEPRPAGPPAPDPVIDVFVMGEVAKSGQLELAPGTTLLQALAAMGGFSDFAATKRVQLRRTDPKTGQETIYPVNYEAILSGASRNGSVTMLDGDVLVVPTRRLFE